jgi:hypothetical protein
LGKALPQGIFMITVANEIAEWLNVYPGPDNLMQLYTNIHEAAHMVYHRDVGHHPEVYGPHTEGKRKFLGGVEALPKHIQLNHDPILVGKCFLGPRYIEILLRGKHSTDVVCFGARRDLELYNDWCWMRQRLRNDLPDNLKDEVDRAVRRDFNDPVFHRRLWETALEYERRISEEAKHTSASSKEKQCSV